MAAHVVLGTDPRRGDERGQSSEPEVVELDDEVGDFPWWRGGRSGAGRPVADGRPAEGRQVRHAGARGAGDRGSVRHRSGAELEAQIREHSVWWPVDVRAAEFAAALVPMHDTPLGPLADGVTLRQIGLRDRLREMDFEFPLARRGPARSGDRTSGWQTWACCCASICLPTTYWRAMPTG